MFNTKIIQLFLTVGVIGVSALETSLSMTKADGSNNIREAISSLVAEARILNAEIIISTFALDRNTIFEDIVKVVLNQVPVNCIVSSEAHARNLWPLIYASTHTLVLYIYASQNLSDFMQLKDISYLLSHNGARPKTLVVTILEETDADFEFLLKHMWQNGILDVSILDISESNNNVTSMVHQYNPFTKAYSIQPLALDVKWYPDKLRDMNGYPIKMDMTGRKGFNLVSRDSNGSVTNFVGPDAMTINAWKTVMNFSVVTHSRKFEPISFRIVNGSYANILGTVQKGVVDVNAATLPVALTLLKDLRQTQSYTSETWCVVMPILYKEDNFFYHGILGLILILILVVLFWSTSFLLKFHSNSWQPLNIFSTIITISVSNYQITSVPERILFLTIIIVGCLYSSSFYTELTVTNIKLKSELPVETFQDLARSGLEPVFYVDFFDVIFDHADDDLMTLKPLVRTADFGFNCGQYLLKHMNICCFLEAHRAQVTVAEGRRQGNTEVMINEKLCFWSPPNGFYLYKYAPYVDRFSQIVLRSQEAGIRDKWFLDFYASITTVFPTPTNNSYSDSDDDTFKYQIVKIIGYGYFISIIVFLGEIIIYYFKKNR